MPTNAQPNGFDPRVLPQGSNPNALTIDQVNIAMRASPVWNSWMQQHGHDPSNVHLSNSDKNGLGKTLELAGFALPEGWEIDDSGNIREETHIGRNILIAAAIAGAAFGGGALLAAYGGGSAISGGTAASLGGVEAGATSGIGASVAGGTLGAAEAGSAAMGLGTAGTIGGVGTVAGAGINGVEGLSGTAAGGSTLSRIGQGIQAARGIGNAISSATDVAASGRRDDTRTALVANGQNIQGQSAFETQLLARESAEAKERQQNLRDVYRASYVANPNRSPFNTTGGPQYSDTYRRTLSDLESQGASRLRTSPTYSTDRMPAVRPYTPIDPRNVEGDLNTEPGTLERVGRWVGPGLSALSTIGSIYGWGR